MWNMKLIVLAAGDAFEVDGFNKLLIKHPNTRKTIIEQYSDFFDVSEIEIVVGYRAMEVMNQYPDYRYHYNRKWQHTGNSYSLSLALDGAPCYIVSCDFFLTRDLLQKMDAHPNCLIVKRTENRQPNSVNASVTVDGEVSKIYQGKCSALDPAVTGIFKVCDSSLLAEWKRRCLQFPRLFAAENLPQDIVKIAAVEILDDELIEINFPEDYIRISNEFRRGRRTPISEH